jgi:hypothetical protein
MGLAYLSEVYVSAVGMGIETGTAGNAEMSGLFSAMTKSRGDTFPGPRIKWRRPGPYPFLPAEDGSAGCWPRAATGGQRRCRICRNEV